MSQQQPPLGSRFTHLFAFSGLSNLADGLLLVGIPLFALTLTTSPGQIALITTVFTLPWLLFGIVAGVVIDRHDRVRVLVAASVARIAALTAGVVAAVNDSLTMPILLGLLAVLGTAEVFADGASSALIPDVTPRERLAAANSRLMGVQLVANSFLGAPIAGFLVAAGAGWVLGVPAGLVVAGVLVAVRGLGRKARTAVADQQASSPAGPSPAEGSVPRAAERAVEPVRSVRRDLREGLGFLFRHRVVRPLVLGGAGFNFLSNAYMAVLVVWVVGPQSAVGVTPEQYGLLATVLAVGGVTGAILAEKIVGRGRERAVIAVTWSVAGGLLVVPPLLPEVWAVAASFMLIGFFNIVGNTATTALRQRIVPSRVLGRVQGASATIAYGAMPLGALTGGIVAEAFGVRALLVMVPIAALVVVALTVRSLTQSVIDEADRTAAPSDDDDEPTGAASLEGADGPGVPSSDEAHVTPAPTPIG